MLKTCLFYFHRLLAVSISTFASLVCAPVGITSSAVGIKLCGIIAGIKKYKSIIQEKKKKHNELVLLGKFKLNIIDILISKALMATYISYHEFVLVNNMLREYYEMKEEIKNPGTCLEYTT